MLIGQPQLMIECQILGITPLSKAILSQKNKKQYVVGSSADVV